MPQATISNPPSLGVIRIDAVLDVVKRLEEDRGTNPAPSAVAKRAALVKLSQEMPSPSGRSTLSYTSTFVPKSSPSVDPKSKERRERLRAMTKEAFPPGKPLPDPYSYCEVQRHRREQALVHHGHLHRQAA